MRCRSRDGSLTLLGALAPWGVCHAAGGSPFGELDYLVVWVLPSLCDVVLLAVLFYIRAQTAWSALFVATAPMVLVTLLTTTGLMLTVMFGPLFVLTVLSIATIAQLIRRRAKRHR